VDLNDIAPGLVHAAAGYWLAPEDVRVSYPAGGHDACFGMEEESFWFAHRNRAILALLRRFPPADGPIFDLGAGNGYVAAALQRAGFPTVAIEPSRIGAANAVARGVANVVCGTLPSTAFAPASAGAIALFDVVEHVENDGAYLRSLAPYLKSGGRLYLTVPAFPWLWSSNDVRSGHYRRYTLRTLRETLRDAGFTVDFETYFFWCLPLPILFLRALRSQNSPSRARRQHRFGGPRWRRLAEACFAFEATWIARGASIPFGGSCLVAASPATAERAPA
jgi:SAM-dependent methyltransferase